MSETPTNVLSHKRFIIHPESRQVLTTLRDALPSIQQERPWVKGLAFFGSRTKGTEHSKSDVDLFVFCDGEQYQREGWVGSPVMKKGRLVVEKNRPTSTRLPQAIIFSMIEHELYKNKINIPVMQTKQGEDNVVIAIDISKGATDKLVAQFIEGVDSNQRPPDKLIAQFLLCVGDPVYRNRAYILDTLEKQPESNKYFVGLMEGLQQFERLSKSENAIKYEHFPKTFEEARTYFITKPY